MASSNRSGYLWVGFAASVILLHAPFLKLPFFWDELGQFVPEALDLFRSGAWIPYSVPPGPHPPGVSGYLAAAWKLGGYSVLSTRLAMLLLASLGLGATLLLAGRLPPGQGLSAFIAAALLCVSPLFFAQSMLAQLDMPAMLFSCLALWLFLEDRILLCAIACTALILVKETGLIAPALFGLWLFAEKRPKQAALFLAPLALLAGWFVFLKHRTGQWFGNAEFTTYNLYFPLHAVRMLMALGRRLYYLCFANLHWLGTIAILRAWKRGMFSARSWRVAATLAGAHVLLVSVLGGAVLERYLVPVLPLLYIAMLRAWSLYSMPWRLANIAAVTGALVAGNFFRPPYPLPYEDNLAFTDFVQVHQAAAHYLEKRYAGVEIITAWPLSQALARPEFGYVSRTLRVRDLGDFDTSRLAGLNWPKPAMFVLFSRESEPAPLLGGMVREVQRRYYRLEPQISPEFLRAHQFEFVKGWQRRGQWVNLYLRQ